jgi:hypothetical protein
MHATGGRTGAAAAAIVAAIALIYARATTAYFFDDDFHWLVQTQAFHPANLLNLSLYDHFYRPVIEVYFFIGLTLVGCNPLPFHLASVATHIATTMVVWVFANSLGRRTGAPWVYGLLSALFFAVQPGGVDAVTWIAAITDQLPALFYVLTLILHLRFLERAGVGWYGATLCAFVACHLTQESAATLLPMMLLVELTFVARGGLSDRCRAVVRAWIRYAPFAALLLAYLAVAYTVNSRSYLVRDQHYVFGLHALPNILNYVLVLYVGKRALLDYAGTTLVLGAVLAFGTPRMRFAVAWIVLTLLPVSFFTWGNVPRYLYVPAIGFSMLVADIVLGFRAQVERRTTPTAARAVAAVALAVLAIRFGVFAKKAADSFPARTAAYATFAQEIRRSNPGATAGSVVFVDQRYAKGIPDAYREPAARVSLCLPDLQLRLVNGSAPDAVPTPSALR